ncbi:MAG TPA: hypothetical protein VK615_08390 [Candidatus Binatia bacterium]|nr:hypothetical protein [Candidatus Binatia bacterium]
MAAPQLKEAEESIYDLLAHIRRRPGLYIGDPELTRLQSFIIGYECGLGRGGLMPRHEEPEFHGFHDWIARRLGYYESTSGWYKMIRERCVSEREAFDRFYELLDEFRAARGEDASS